MKIVVLIKEVPDTNADRALSLETGLAERIESALVLDEIVERALEVALAHADAQEDTEVLVLSMAPAAANAAVRKALAIGAHRAVVVTDEALNGADLKLTAEVLAAALRYTGFDLIIAGNQSTDGAGGVLPAMLAEMLGIPQATGLDSLDIGATEINGTRSTDDTTMQIRAMLPAIVSVTERHPDVRFPNFKGIMAAKKKPVEVLSLADLGIDADVLTTPRSIMTQIHPRPPRAAGLKIVDSGDAGAKLAEFLISNHLA